MTKPKKTFDRLFQELVFAAVKFSVSYRGILLEMDSASFSRWAEDRAASDDDIDEIISAKLVDILNTAAENAELIELLNKKHGGSRMGRSPNVNRDHASGHARIWQDYFDVNAIYSAAMFRRRFRMRKHLFLKIHDAVVQECPYFVQKPYAVGNQGLSSLQKITAAMRLFTYGVTRDAVDEYVRIGESTAHEAFKKFVNSVVHIFGEQYLRQPTEGDLRRHMEINRARGWVGMFGSLDCTHWNWKNCPVGLQSQYRDKDGENSIVLEAVATANLWIWHPFIGVPGSNNDISVVERSPILVNMLKGIAPAVGFTLNGHHYPMFYLLTDGMFPDYTVFMKPFQIHKAPNESGCEEAGRSTQRRGALLWCTESSVCHDSIPNNLVEN